MHLVCFFYFLIIFHCFLSIVWFVQMYIRIWYSHFIVEIVLYLVLQINIFVCDGRYRLQLEYSSEVELLSKSSLLCENIFAFTHILVGFVCHIGFSIWLLLSECCVFLLKFLYQECIGWLSSSLFTSSVFKSLYSRSAITRLSTLAFPEV